jgi:hypothetical protein
VFGYAGHRLLVLFLPRVILPVEPWRVRIAGIEADRG